MLYNLLSGSEPLGPTELSAPGCETPPMSPQLQDGGELLDWDNLKDVIVASLRTGIFIDCKFYAPVANSQPNKPPNLQPLYFCSSINPGVTQKLSSGTSANPPQVDLGRRVLPLRDGSIGRDIVHLARSTPNSIISWDTPPDCVPPTPVRRDGLYLGL